MKYKKLKRFAECLRYLGDCVRVGTARARRNKCSRAYPQMIFKEVAEFREAYCNCAITRDRDEYWTPRQVGYWWREKHGVYPQADGTYGFLSEKDFFWFVLKWS